MSTVTKEQLEAASAAVNAADDALNQKVLEVKSLVADAIDQRTAFDGDKKSLAASIRTNAQAQLAYADALDPPPPILPLTPPAPEPDAKVEATDPAAGAGSATTV